MTTLPLSVMRGFALGNERRRCTCGRQTIKRHVNKRGVSARSGCSCCRFKPFPLRASGFVNVNMRVHQAGQNGGVTKVLNGNLRGQLITQNNIEDSAVFDEHSCRFDSLRGHDST